MRTFGMGWKNSDVEGEVIAKPRKNARRVRGTLGVSFMKLNTLADGGGGEGGGGGVATPPLGLLHNTLHIN